MELTATRSAVNLFQFVSLFLHRIIYKWLQSNRGGRRLVRSDINEFGLNEPNERTAQRELAKVRCARMSERAMVTVLASRARRSRPSTYLPDQLRSDRSVLRGRSCHQIRKLLRGMRFGFSSTRLTAAKEENCFAVCKTSFCSSRQRTFFYTTSQVLCQLLI